MNKTVRFQNLCAFLQTAKFHSSESIHSEKLKIVPSIISSILQLRNAGFGPVTLKVASILDGSFACASNLSALSLTVQARQISASCIAPSLSYKSQSLRIIIHRRPRKLVLESLDSLRSSRKKIQLESNIDASQLNSLSFLAAGILRAGGRAPWGTGKTVNLRNWWYYHLTQCGRAHDWQAKGRRFKSRH
jgi:hypothetical protein